MQSNAFTSFKSNSFLNGTRLSYMATVIGLSLSLNTQAAMNTNSSSSNNAKFSANIGSSNIETISVSGTKTAREINEIASSITRIDSDDIDAMGASNIRTLLRYEPGVSVEGNGRYGLSSFNIRGINGDRVLILIDNIPVADEFSFGPNLSSRRDFIDIDLIKSVDIVRGPASTIYGSDAIGGVVSFKTKDPSDLTKDGESFAARVKTGHVSEANEFYLNGMVAGVGENWQWLLNASVRDSKEFETFFNDDVNRQLNGPTRKSADPQNNESASVLAKLIYQSSPAHRLTFTAEQFEQESNTTLLSEVGAIVRGTRTITSIGVDERERSRLSADYLYQPKTGGHFTRFAGQAFYQYSESVQLSELSRVGLAPNASPWIRTRDSQFSQEVKGLHLQFDYQFTGLAEHYLIYGVSYEETDSEGLREGETRDIASGANIPEFSVFPARDFPISNLKERSIFVQNEMQFLDGRLLLSPGVRYDSFTLNPSSDTLFENANPGVEISKFSDSQVSKKLGLIYNLSDSYKLWIQYSEGFRIPPMDDVNVGFTNFAGGYTSLANPDLLPESVDSYEIGLRGLTDTLTWNVSAFHNDYDNFIESLSVIGFNPTTRLLEFQATNIESVEISGIEGQLTWFIGEVFNSKHDWQMRLSHSIQHSENKATGDELDSVMPVQTVAGIQYQDVSAPWHVELAVTYTQEANAISDGDLSAFFIAPSFTTFDLLGHLQVTDNIRINAGIFNITDKQYWLASEVRGRDASDDLSRFTSAGRNFSINLIANF